MVKKKNSLWFSVECTLTHNGMRHNSGQNLLWNHSAAARESTAYLNHTVKFYLSIDCYFSIQGKVLQETITFIQ